MDAERRGAETPPPWLQDDSVADSDPAPDDLGSPDDAGGGGREQPAAAAPAPHGGHRAVPAHSAANVPPPPPSVQPQEAQRPAPRPPQTPVPPRFREEHAGRGSGASSPAALERRHVVPGTAEGGHHRTGSRADTPVGGELAPPPGLDQIKLVRRPQKAPASGWRRALHKISGGRINPGDSAEQRRRDQLSERVRRPIDGDFRLAVLSLKGGVGKTTTTIGLGSTLAALRGDRVIAVDANPDLGTLGARVPQQTASTVRSLLDAPSAARYSDVRAHTSQSSSRLEVLASERDPAVSEAFSEDDYRRTVDVLRNHYNVILTDCGTGLMHSAMKGVLDLADAIVLVTSPAIDGAQSASATLDWLNHHGYERLAGQAVVAISASKPGSAPVDVQMMSRHFLGRTRGVQVIPYDDHLAEGAEVDFDVLKTRTRTAFLELAALVSDAYAPAGTVHPRGR